MFSSRRLIAGNDDDDVDVYFFDHHHDFHHYRLTYHTFCNIFFYRMITLPKNILPQALMQIISSTTDDVNNPHIF